MTDADFLGRCSSPGKAHLSPFLSPICDASEHSSGCQGHHEQHTEGSVLSNQSEWEVSHHVFVVLKSPRRGSPDPRVPSHTWDRQPKWQRNALGRASRVDEVHAARSTQSLDSASSPGMHWDAAQEGPWSQNSEQCPCRCTSLSTAPLPLSCPPRIRTFLCLSSYMHSSAAPLEIWICRAGTWLWGQIWGEAFPTPRKEAITSGHCGLTVFAVPWSGPCLPAAMINPSLSSQDRRADDCIMT